MAQALTDHDRIREWAESHGAVPASVRGTGGRGDAGILRLDMPGGARNESLQPISWDDWFKKFDAQDLALLIEESDQPSTFSKLVNRADVNVDVNQRRRGAASPSSIREDSTMPNPNRPNQPRKAGSDADDVESQTDKFAGSDEDEDLDDVDETDEEFEEDGAETGDDADTADEADEEDEEEPR